MKANHILVDFENVPHLQLDLIGDTPVTIHLFVGEKQNTVSIDLVTSLLALRATCAIKLIRTKSTGKNALDFVLASTLGQLVTAEPDAYFHIPPKDKGFDSSVEHLRDQKLHVARHDSLAGIPILRTKALPTPEARAEAYRKALPPDAAKRPQRKTALLSAIGAFFGKQLLPGDLECILAHLQKDEVLSISAAGKVTYAETPSPLVMDFA